MDDATKRLFGLPVEDPKQCRLVVGRSGELHIATPEEFKSGGTANKEAPREEESEDGIMPNQLYQELQKSTGCYVSDVIPDVGMDNVERVCKFIQEQSQLSYTRALLIISGHNDHIHVVHDCSFSNQTCRCDFLKKTFIKFGLRRGRRTVRRRPLCNELGISDCKNILTYFSTKGRQLYYIRVGRYLERISFQPEDLQVQGPKRCRIEESLEIYEEMDDHELRLEGQEDYGSIGRIGRGSKAAPKKVQKYGEKTQKIVDLLKTRPTFPIESICNVDDWLKDDQLQFVNIKDKTCSNILNNWSKQLLSWTLDDFNEFYSQPDCKPVFSAGYESFDKYYYDIDTSVELMIKYLDHQFYNEQENVTHFVTDLYNVLERKVPKLNSLLVFSPPDCGKSWFFDAFFNYFMCVGKICTINKHNSFGFQECYSKRVIHWNEPNYDPDLIDKLKELLGGDTTAVAVKYMPDMPVYRTPFIITTNVRVSIMNHPAFKNRTSIFYFRAAPQLKALSKKLHPLAVYPFFVHYGMLKVKEIINTED